MGYGCLQVCAAWRGSLGALSAPRRDAIITNITRSDACPKLVIPFLSLCHPIYSTHVLTFTLSTGLLSPQVLLSSFRTFTPFTLFQFTPGRVSILPGSVHHHHHHYYFYLLDPHFRVNSSLKRVASHFGQPHP
ncbi:hypothetical protein K432DRAFT_201343 [Lepidopterella palustris CBS 459.81]|uniref:Uncharacterized protein n=1 Tax=Lepidopterella palustris CBS 459.81 TaxID=1314670 RepID=A0A8E2DZ11_9PEZI|nr:hypothetical protein K432DRAFT_201343 [Lepidopterella palustris CBS 459.81]